MRQTVCLLVSCGLLVGGLWLLYEQLLVAPAFRGWMLMGTGVMIAVGGVWLFEDFVRPIFRPKGKP